MGPGNIRAGLRHLARMRRVRVLAVAATSTAAVATVIGLAIPAGASPVAAQSAASRSAAAHSAASRSAAVSGAQHFQLVTTSATTSTPPVIGWGVVTAAGVDHEGSSNSNTATDKFVFPKGTFKVTHTGPFSIKANPTTCFITGSSKGTFKISGGTGAYKGISGKGTFSLAVVGIAPKTKSGACNQNANPVGFQEVIDATGTVKLP